MATWVNLFHTNFIFMYHFFEEKCSGSVFWFKNKQSELLVLGGGGRVNAKVL